MRTMTSFKDFKTAKKEKENELSEVVLINEYLIDLNIFLSRRY